MKHRRGAEVQGRSRLPIPQLLSAAAGSIFRGGHNSRDANSSGPLPHAWLTRLLHEGPRTPGNIWDGNRSTDVLPCRGGAVWGWCFTGNTRRGCVAKRNRTRRHVTRRGHTRQIARSSKGMAAADTGGSTDHAASVFHVKHWPRLQQAVRPLARNGNKGALHRCRRPERRRRFYAESAISRADTVSWTLARLYGRSPPSGAQPREGAATRRVFHMKHRPGIEVREHPRFPIATTPVVGGREDNPGKALFVGHQPVGSRTARVPDPCLA